MSTVLTCQIDQVIKTAGSDTIQFIRESRHFCPLGGDSDFIYLGGGQRVDITIKIIIRPPTDYEEDKVVQVIMIAGTGVLPSPRDKFW